MPQIIYQIPQRSSINESEIPAVRETAKNSGRMVPKLPTDPAISPTEIVKIPGGSDLFTGRILLTWYYITDRTLG